MSVPSETTPWWPLITGTFLELPGNPCWKPLSPPPSLAGLLYCPLAGHATDTPVPSQPLGPLSPSPAAAPKGLLKHPSSEGCLVSPRVLRVIVGSSVVTGAALWSRGAGVRSVLPRKAEPGPPSRTCLGGDLDPLNTHLSRRSYFWSVDPRPLMT